MKIELLHDVGSMLFDSLVADTEIASDLLVLISLGN